MVEESLGGVKPIPLAPFLGWTPGVGEGWER